ncbi:hypothetical protein [Paeniglutamicibacter antarcticus]|uniref:Uncharacterized protein n=1 Tax=Paeniglutamicibacter antarcticus TaxID=494023 RepID=A0ABP9TJX9_9MICC
MIHRDRSTSPYDAELLAWPEEHREWARTARGTMFLFGANESAVDSLLAEARQCVESSDQTPTDLFGKPESYGRSKGRGLRTPVSLLEGSLPFSTMAGASQVLLISLGMLLFFLGIWLGFSDGWREPSFSGPVLLLFLLVTGLVGLGFWGWVVHTRGRIGSARALWFVALAACAAVISLVAYLDDFALPGPPNWIMPVAGAGLCVVAFKFPQARERALVDDTHWADARWFARAENLLRGRYHFSRAQAVESLRESKDHRLRAGDAESLAAEFGNVEVFAAQLAASNPPAIKRGVLIRRVASVSALLIWGAVILLPMLLEDGITVLTAFGVIAWILFLAGAIKAWRQAPMETQTRRLKRERDQMAATLGADDKN